MVFFKISKLYNFVEKIYENNLKFFSNLNLNIEDLLNEKDLIINEYKWEKIDFEIEYFTNRNFDILCDFLFEIDFGLILKEFDICVLFFMLFKKNKLENKLMKYLNEKQGYGLDYLKAFKRVILNVDEIKLIKHDKHFLTWFTNEFRNTLKNYSIDVENIDDYYFSLIFRDERERGECGYGIYLDGQFGILMWNKNEIKIRNRLEKKPFWIKNEDMSPCGVISFKIDFSPPEFKISEPQIIQIQGIKNTYGTQRLYFSNNKKEKIFLFREICLHTLESFLKKKGFKRCFYIPNGFAHNGDFDNLQKVIIKNTQFAKNNGYKKLNYINNRYWYKNL